jgi:DeoR/GlpR family transcriptional regulator of sugar metabolism
MLAEQRQRLILERLDREGAVSIAELSDLWRVSRETVRRDINHLAERQKLFKTHGGAVSLPASEPGVAERQSINAEGKRAIGDLAASLVPDGAAVILDSGATTRCIADALRARKRLTVYTNDLGICHRLANRNDNRVLLLGGELQRHEESTIGLDAIAMLARYFADFAFVGVGGLTPDGHLTDFTREGSEFRARMLVAAKSVSVVADHTKFNRITPVRVANFERAQRLLTDRRPDKKLRQALEAKGIAIVVAGREAG